MVCLSRRVWASLNEAGAKARVAAASRMGDLGGSARRSTEERQQDDGVVKIRHLSGHRFLVPSPVSLGLASLPQYQSRRLVNAGAMTAALFVMLLAFVSQGGLAGGTPAPHVQRWDLPPEPPPFLLRDISEQDA